MYLGREVDFYKQSKTSAGKGERSYKLLHSLRDSSQQSVCGWPMGVASCSELLWSSLELASGSFSGKHNQHFTDNMLNMGIQSSVKQPSKRVTSRGNKKPTRFQYVVVDVIAAGVCEETGVAGCPGVLRCRDGSSVEDHG